MYVLWFGFRVLLPVYLLLLIWTKIAQNISTVRVETDRHELTKVLGSGPPSTLDEHHRFCCRNLGSEVRPRI